MRLAAVAAIAGSALVACGGDGGELSVTGDPLPRFDAAASDAATGLVAPEVSGADFGGDPVAIESDGTPKAIVFLTHW